jgi:NAD(P)-dependent dehydrogenase (short-subunit alcohol dehydrogenase family)
MELKGKNAIVTGATAIFCAGASRRFAARRKLH